VQFLAAIENLYEMGVRTFIEVGPRPILTGLVRSILKIARQQRLPWTLPPKGLRPGRSGKSPLPAGGSGISGPAALLGSGESVLPPETSMKVSISGANYQNPTPGLRQTG